MNHKPYSEKLRENWERPSVYRRVEGKGGNTWLVPLDGDSPASEIHVDTHDPNSRGYGGNLLTFKLEDGSEYHARGPWNSNPDVLLKDTGVDMRDQCRTFVVLSRGREFDENYSMTMTDVVYKDPDGGLMGRYERWKDLAKDYPEAQFFYNRSFGGSSYGPIPASET